MAKGYKKFIDKVNEYQDNWLNGKTPKFKNNFDNPYNLKKDWKKYYPFVNDPGVYAIFDKKKDLIYIGRAQSFGKRFGDYFGYDENRNCKIRGPLENWGGKEPLYILAVKVCRYFESASLEEFLIWELDPPVNIKNKKPT